MNAMFFLCSYEVLNPISCILSLFRLSHWVKFSAADILKYISYFSQKTCFDISCNFSPLETICIKMSNPFFFFLEKNKNGIILLSAELPQRVVRDYFLGKKIQMSGSTFSQQIFIVFYFSLTISRYQSSFS